MFLLLFLDQTVLGDFLPTGELPRELNTFKRYFFCFAFTPANRVSTHWLIIFPEFPVLALQI